MIRVTIYAWIGSKETDWEPAELFDEADEYIVCIEDHDLGPDNDWAPGLEEDYHTDNMKDAIQYASALMAANSWLSGDPWAIPNKWKPKFQNSVHQK